MIQDGFNHYWESNIYICDLQERNTLIERYVTNNMVLHQESITNTLLQRRYCLFTILETSSNAAITLYSPYGFYNPYRIDISKTTVIAFHGSIDWQLIKCGSVEGSFYFNDKTSNITFNNDSDI